MITIKVSTYSLGEYEFETETYDENEINQQLNSVDVNTILIGRNIFSRIEIKGITVVSDAPPEGAIEPIEPVETNTPTTEEEPIEEEIELGAN